jgi:CheY-like chemotaxis protein
LEKRPEFQIIGQASDGLEAIQKAEELQPDLILLDIGLPKLNGMEAAKRIRIVAPHTKILFVSQESDSDVVGEALNVGALGFVHKIRARSDLLPAIEAVHHGRRFVSGNLEVPQSIEAAAIQTFHRHEVVFYSSDTGFLEGLSEFIADTLKAGKTVMVVATESHREGLVHILKARGLDVDGAIQRGTYIESDSAETLSTMLVNGVPDRKQLFERIGGLIDAAAQAQKERHGVSACGEVAPLLLAKGEEEAAIQVEQLWDDLVTNRGVDLLCAYPLSSFPDGQEGQVFKSICAEHSAVYFR